MPGQTPASLLRLLTLGNGDARNSMAKLAFIGHQELAHSSLEVVYVRVTMQTILEPALLGTRRLVIALRSPSPEQVVATVELTATTVAHPVLAVVVSALTSLYLYVVTVQLSSGTSRR